MTEQIPILVVDDVPANLIALEALLREPGLEIIQATSGTEALELLLKKEAAVALIDVQMPEMDGFELAELMRGYEQTRRVPIIFVTAGAAVLSAKPLASWTVTQAYESGAVDFIVKPIDPDILRSKVGVFVRLETQRRELIRKVSELEDALRLNDQMAAVLGHDLRNPLTSILLGAQQLGIMHRDGETRVVLERVRLASERMSRMILQLLDVARVRAHGGLEVRPARADVRRLCENIIAETENEHGTGRIALEAYGDLESVLDPDRIGQVMANLLGNALRHGEKGGPIRAELDGGEPERIRFSVTNRGAIPASLLPHVFVPFRTARGRIKRADDAGLGLGLYIVDQLVRAHGGRVSVSTPEGTTSVVVELPRQAARPA